MGLIEIVGLSHNIADGCAVAEANYFDQPHLTRSLRRFIGRTPAQLAGKTAGGEHKQLSFLYKTSPVR